MVQTQAVEVLSVDVGSPEVESVRKRNRRGAQWRGGGFDPPLSLFGPVGRLQ